MKAKSRRESWVPSRRLEKMIDEAIVDCYNESEQAMGLFTVIEEHLSLPFPTSSGERRRQERRTIPVVDLPLPSPRPGCRMDRSILLGRGPCQFDDTESIFCVITVFSRLLASQAARTS